MKTVGFFKLKTGQLQFVELHDDFNRVFQRINSNVSFS